MSTSVTGQQGAVAAPNKAVEIGVGLSAKKDDGRRERPSAPLEPFLGLQPILSRIGNIKHNSNRNGPRAASR